MANNGGFYSDLASVNAKPKTKTVIWCPKCKDYRYCLKQKELRDLNLHWVFATTACAECGWNIQRKDVKPKLRQSVFNTDQHECIYCASTDNLTLDHLTPVSLGGANTLENLATCCKTCNSCRRNKPIYKPRQYGRYRIGATP